MLAAIDRYRAAGLDGVEVFYASHDREQTLLLADRCAELGLLATGSSDYHGPEHRLFSRIPRLRAARARAQPRARSPPARWRRRPATVPASASG